MNRTIRRTSEGLEYEPDQRHAELIVEQAGMSSCKPVSTPTQYRGIAARLKYLALDRTDVQFAAKDGAKHMAQPAVLNCVKLKRVARYLEGKPRYVQLFELQYPLARLLAYSDSDWAVDRQTRKSSS